MKSPIGKILLIASAFAILDQLTKVYAVKNFQDPISVIGEFFTFRLSGNTGIAFGIELPTTGIIVLTIILLLLVIYLLQKELNLKKNLTIISSALIIGGGLSNLIDRFTYGSVVDFISIWKWPIFNLADIYITVGVLLIIIFYGKIKRV